MRMALRLAALLVLALHAVASAAAVELEPIPEIRTEGLDPEVAEALAAAAARIESLGADAAVTERAAAWGELARLHHAHRLLGPARAAYRNAAALDPGNAEWSYLLARVELDRGDPQAAEQALLAAREAAPENVSVLVALARLRRDAGRIDDSIALARTALEIEPGSAAAALALAEAGLDAGEFALARDTLVKLWREQPAATRLATLLATALHGLGEDGAAEEVLRRRGDGPVAVRDPWLEAVQARGVGVQAALDRGEAASERGDWSTAAEQFAGAAAAAPGRAEAWSNLGAAKLRLGDLQGAEAALERARELTPEEPAVLLNLAALAAHTGRLERSIALYRSVLDLQPDSVPAMRSLARVLAAADRPEEALLLVREGLARAARDPALRIGELSALHALGRSTELRTRLDATLSEMPDVAPVLALAVRLFAASPFDDLRDGERALAIATRLDRSGRSVETLELLAMALAERGDFRGAVAAQSAALAGGATSLGAVRRQAMEAALSGYERGEPLRDPGFD